MRRKWVEEHWDFRNFTLNIWGLYNNVIRVLKKLNHVSIKLYVYICIYTPTFISISVHLFINLNLYTYICPYLYLDIQKHISTLTPSISFWHHSTYSSFWISTILTFWQKETNSSFFTIDSLKCSILRYIKSFQND